MHYHAQPRDQSRSFDRRVINFDGKLYSMKQPQKYAGLNNEINGGMTNIGRIIRDAWVFELIPETETCEGWLLQGIDALMDKVHKEWDKYGCLVSNLPEDLRARHQRIHGEWLQRAKAAGWSGETETNNEV